MQAYAGTEGEREYMIQTENKQLVVNGTTILIKRLRARSD